MEQKKIWMSFLIIGISIVLLNLGSCQQEVEYRLDTEFIYFNQSNRTVTFTKFDQGGRRIKVSLESSESDTTVYLASGGFENPDLNSCCQGLLHGVLDGSDQGIIVVSFDNKSCLIEEPAIISNYESEIIENRFFRYKFTFTDEILDNATDCQ
jgi:hypothetical protein